jgi:hypothetical protein
LLASQKESDSIKPWLVLLSLLLNSFVLKLVGSRYRSWDWIGGSHGNFGPSIFAEHLLGKLWLVSEEELMVVCAKFGAT